VARQFDRVCEVLTALGYLAGGGSAGGGGEVRVTDQGRHLMRLYSELDLVAAECLRTGLWDDLTVPELAAALSVLVFEARRPDDASPPRVPGGQVRDVIKETVRLWGRLDALEREHHLDFLRQPDAGFAWAAYHWAEGDELDDVLNVVELAAGDFVRWMKQLLDLAGQVADAAGDGPLRDTARGVVKAVRRGVVAYSSLNDD
jgi:ATP-dependent RNA helicase HelY